MLYFLEEIVNADIRRVALVVNRAWYTWASNMVLRYQTKGFRAAIRLPYGRNERDARVSDRMLLYLIRRVYMPEFPPNRFRFLSADAKPLSSAQPGIGDRLWCL
jgi:hypothetical protein